MTPDDLTLPEALDRAAERFIQARDLVYPTDSPRDRQRRGEWDIVLNDLSLAAKYEQDEEGAAEAAAVANRAHRSIDGYAQFYREHAPAHRALQEAAEAAAFAAGLLAERAQSGK
jgi:hypothetical protein